jgi:wyosine [tRNA(Phe)-imidazoG37] synthetase (radical SAM superfamily)
MEQPMEAETWRGQQEPRRVAPDSIAGQIKETAKEYADDLGAPYLSGPLERFIETVTSLDDFDSLVLAESKDFLSVYVVADLSVNEETDEEVADFIDVINQAFAELHASVYGKPRRLGLSIEYINVHHKERMTLINALRHGDVKSAVEIEAPVPTRITLFGGPTAA